MSFRPDIGRLVRRAALSAAVGVFAFVPVFCASPAEEPPAAPPALGDRLVTFPAPDLMGKSVDVAALLAGKPALITFWASWCQPCIAEVPELRRLYAEYRGNGFMVVGVGVKQGGDDSERQLRAAKRQTIDYPLVHDETGEYQKAYALTSLPLNVLVDRAGIVRFKGPLLPADIGQRVSALLTESASPEPRRE